MHNIDVNGILEILVNQLLIFILYRRKHKMINFSRIVTYNVVGNNDNVCFQMSTTYKNSIYTKEHLSDKDPQM